MNIKVRNLVVNNKPSFERTQKEIKCGRVTLKLTQSPNDLIDQSFIKYYFKLKVLLHQMIIDY